MNTRFVPRDERTTAVEDASYRWGYLFLAYGLFANIVFRGFVRGESSWELLVLLVVSGVVTTAYQGLRKVVSWQWMAVALVTVTIGGGIALGLALLR